MAGKERTFAEGATLVSVTDLQGVIKYCNKDFIEVSGYTEQELVDSNHNLVRHKDMPKAAFADLWTTIKADKPWQGLVKNRCKNGDYYWVDAYVTPVFEAGKKVGYQSIRSCPSRKQIETAQSLYVELLQNPQRTFPSPTLIDRMQLSTKVNSLIGLAFISFLVTQFTAGHLFSSELFDVVTNVWISILFTGLFYLFNRDVVMRIARLNTIIKRVSEGDLTENIQILKRDELGEAVMSTKMLQGRLKAIIGRFTESSQDLVVATDVLSETSYMTKNSMTRQHSETELVATAMNEMSATVAEVAENTARNAELASFADNAANSGKQMVSETRETILELSADVSKVADSINVLAQECQQIRDITDSISGIADQTNLLALNAAIEAARAGEQGRGFAVVADEVRVLSSRTQQSTVEINSMIERLQTGSSNAVVAMEKGLEKVNQSVRQIQGTEDAFTEIVTSVADVNDMNMQIATAAEEQSKVTEEMNKNVTSISVQSYKTADNIVQLESKIEQLTKMSTSLKLQLNQYNLGEPASHFDFDMARNAHLAWKIKVRDFLKGDVSAITKQQACSHKECALGRWYYSDGAKQYKQLSYFKQIEAPHARLHQIVKEILELHDNNELEKADELYQELGPLSENIVELLNKTEKSVK
ncbi:methyl-accepting chemotaxis protein [Agarivorans litoreus]|uniref:methyl-accepting chemotaxis protein n=1 Tax=Agarivorans litoreus TaxID=1510455 RepID=UPI001C7D93D8|nr:methyl-accepting chemotaxis protein [Agarivorans litoreus]